MPLHQVGPGGWVTIRPAWAGETAWVLGGGASLADAPLARLAGRRCIAVTRSFAAAPWADVIHAGDGQWWRWHGAETRAHSARLRTTVAAAARPDDMAAIADAGAIVLGYGGKLGLALAPDRLCGRNSGHQAANLAAHLVGPAGTVALVGFDGRPGWWHAGYPDWRGDHKAALERMVPGFQSLAAAAARNGPRIVNCTPGSALTMFPAARIEDLL
ncbi:MAG: hypothetical protein AB7P02_17205 [Alphaproteobacteria bacterium]